MKKPLQLFALLILIMAVLNSCKKYPDGPSLSFRTKKARISAIWGLSRVLINGIDKTTDFAAANPNYTLRIDKIGNFFINDDNGQPGRGTWKFDEEKENFTMTSSNLSNTTFIITAKILKLKNKELAYSYTVTTGDTYEMHYMALETKTGH